MRFRPPWWSVLVTAAVGALLLGLGVWQVQRGLAKQELQAAYDNASTGQAATLDVSSLPPPEGEIVRVKIEGSFEGRRQLLLDNQPRERVPGYRVWTLLRSEAGNVMVDRGWVAASPDRAKHPDITISDARRSIHGYWRSLPEPGLRLNVDNCASISWPKVVNYPTEQDLECIFELDVLPGLLLMDAELDGGFVREWTTPNALPPSRHYGYAAQWFALAATLLFLFIKLNLRKPDSRRE